MKSLKIDHEFAELIRRGQKTSTWRINDDKDLHVHDQVALIDKVASDDPSSWRQIGVATITSILEKPLGQVTQADMEKNETFTSIQEVIKTYRNYYGPQVGVDTPVKIIRFTFDSLEGERKGEGNVKRQAKLFADGGSRGNPGPSASGYVLLSMDDQIIVENGLYVGITTNNQAEYQALKIGMEEALKRGVQELDVYMDSMLVVNQMKRVYKVKNKDLLAIHQSTAALCAQFSKIAFTHVPRELNKQADAIVNEVLDAQVGQKNRPA